MSSKSQSAMNFKKQDELLSSEVDDALVAIRTYRREHEARLIQRKAASNATRLYRARYNDGVAPYSEVLDSERSLFDAELERGKDKSRL